MSEVLAASHNEKLLELAMQRAIHGKGELAVSLAEGCLAPGVTMNEREASLAFDIVRILLGAVELPIRRHLAAYLAGRNDLPKDIVKTLIHDEIAVAYPLLLHTPAIDDAMLLDVIGKRGKPHQLAIARRTPVRVPVSQALIELRDEDVIEVLLYNEAAELDEGGFDALVRTYCDTKALQAPIVRRPELSVAQGNLLFQRVDRPLQRILSALTDTAETST